MEIHSLALAHYDGSIAIRRTFFERLVMLAAPDVANRILDEALRRAQLTDVPTGGPLLERFARGPMRDAVEWTLGDDFADAFMEDLEPILRKMVGSGLDPDDTHVRFSARPYDKRTPVVKAPVEDFELEDITELDLDVEAVMSVTKQQRHRPMHVVVASRSPERVRDLQGALGAAAKVLRVEDVFDLVDCVHDDDDADVVVVLDGRESAVRPTTLAAASEELPERTKVVLWGTAESESDELDAIEPTAEGWTRFGFGTTPDDLAHFLIHDLEHEPKA